MISVPTGFNIHAFVEVQSFSRPAACAPGGASWDGLSRAARRGILFLRCFGGVKDPDHVSTEAQIKSRRLAVG